MKKNIFFVLLFLCGVSIAERPNIEDYGAGKMIKPGNTYYVSLAGQDTNDGKSLKSAWKDLRKSFAKLRRGDTLYIAGGEYFVPRELRINVNDGVVNYDAQCGVPGSPIRIIGMPGERVVLSGSLFIPSDDSSQNIAEFKLKREPIYDSIMEVPSRIELQRVYAPELVRQIPGTFYCDKSTKKTLVHFVAKKHYGIKVATERIGIRIHGSYIHLENLIFTDFYEGIYMRQNRPYKINVATNNTIKNCQFYYNYKNGFVLDSASKTLVIGNRGFGNTERGTGLSLVPVRDVLITGNWFGPCPHTLRQLNADTYNYALNNYGLWEHRGAGFNVVGNYFESALAFRLKPGSDNSWFEDNIVVGDFWAESKPVNNCTFRNNCFLGKVGWTCIGSNVNDQAFAKSPMKFYGNVRSRAKFKPHNPIIYQAEKLRMPLPKIEYPDVTIKNLRADYLTNRTAAILWSTPDNDGWGTVEYRRAGNPYTRKVVVSQMQGSRHFIVLTDLRANTKYEYRAIFRGRRGEKAQSEIRSFTTATKARTPGVLEVGPGKLSLEAASAWVVPGDIVKLMPGRHYGRFCPANSGLPGKPITLLGNGAIIDGLKFYYNLINLDGKSHIIIDGVQFTGIEETAREAAIFIRGGSDNVVRNCRYGLNEAINYTAGKFIHARNSERLLIQNNIIWGGDYPITIVGGKKHKIQHNTVADATMWSTSLWDIDDWEISDNIFYRPCVPDKVNTAIFMNNVIGKFILRGNVYYSPVSTHPVGGTIRGRASVVLKASKTLAEWQKLTGQDLDSFNVDPQFVNPQKGDFRLKSTSPVLSKGAKLSWK